MGKHDETSVWKKEISFRRKPKQAPKAEPVWPQEAAQAAPAAPDAKTSVWKKEISFGRKGKPKPPKPVSLPPVEAPPLPLAAATDAKSSVWKKEISFGRKAKPEASAAEAPPQPVEEAKRSVWKKEIGFGRKPKTEVEATPAPVEAAAPAPESTRAVPPVSPPVDKIVPEPAPPAPLGHLSRSPAEHPRPEHVGEQMVVAVPVTAVVERDQE